VALLRLSGLVCRLQGGEPWAIARRATRSGHRCGKAAGEPRCADLHAGDASEGVGAQNDVRLQAGGEVALRRKADLS
jgi:hypothetical protein